MRTVQVGGQTFDLVLPRSLAARHALQFALGEATSMQTRVQVAAAALFLCADTTKTSGPGAPRFTYDVQAYGFAVLDYLLAKGVPEAEIYRAGGLALDMILASIPSAQERAEAEGKSEAPSGG